MTAIGVSPKFGAGRLFLADARLTLAALNHIRCLMLERTLGVSREQANVVTFVLALTAAELAHDVARRLPHPYVSGESAVLGILGLSDGVHSLAGPASRGIPHLEPLLALGLLGGVALPGLRRAARSVRERERRIREGRIVRYVAAQRAGQPTAT